MFTNPSIASDIRAIQNAVWDFVDGEAGMSEVMDAVDRYGDQVHRVAYRSGWDDGFENGLTQ